MKLSEKIASGAVGTAVGKGLWGAIKNGYGKNSFFMKNKAKGIFDGAKDKVGEIFQNPIKKTLSGIQGAYQTSGFDKNKGIGGNVKGLVDNYLNNKEFSKNINKTMSGVGTLALGAGALGGIKNFFNQPAQNMQQNQQGPGGQWGYPPPAPVQPSLASKIIPGAATLGLGLAGGYMLGGKKGFFKPKLNSGASNMSAAPAPGPMP